MADTVKKMPPSPAESCPAINGYETPAGVYPGKPDICYPNTPGFTPKEYCPVGGVILADGELEYNTDRRTVKVTVKNTGDRPIQIGSHYHFFEVNRYLEFDRPKTFGYHRNIPATTAVRFEAGEEKEVELVAFAGKQRIIGFNGLVQGYAGLEDSPVYYPKRIESIRRMHEYGFRSEDEPTIQGEAK